MDKVDSVIIKVDNTVVSDLIETVSSIKDSKDIEALKSIEKKIESAILILHGDLRSIDRQIDQRELTKSLDIKMGEAHNNEQYEEWQFKIRRAMQYKRDQIRTLERVLGNARDAVLDKRFLHIDKIHKAAVCGAIFLDDVDKAKSSEDVINLKSRSDLDAAIQTLDSTWENWDD